MRQIWKYPIKALDESIFEVPQDHKILKLDSIRGQLCIWMSVIVDDQPLLKLTFNSVGTGSLYDPDQIGGYVDSVVDGPFIWHIFYKTTPE